MNSFFSFRNLAITLLSFAIIGVFALVTVNIAFLNPITQALKDFSITDVFYQVQQNSGHIVRNNAITIVDMTDLYDRGDIAEALEQIEMCNPKVVGVDMVFEGENTSAGTPTRDYREADSMLMQVARDYRNIVYSHRLLDYKDDVTGYSVDVHSFFTDSIPVTEGFTNMERQLYGGIKRVATLQTLIQGEVKPSFLAQVVDMFTGQRIESTNENLNINFTPTEFDVLPHDSVLQHPELIEDRVVLFGAMYEEGDMQYTPLGKMAGVKLLAYGAQSLLDQKEILYLPLWLSWLVTFILVYFTFWLQENYIIRMQRIRNGFCRVVLSSDYFVGIVMFVWMVILMGVSALVFNQFNMSISLGWTFAAIAFLNASEELYQALKELKVCSVN